MLFLVIGLWSHELHLSDCKEHRSIFIHNPWTSTHLPVSGVLSFAIHPRNSCMSLKSFLQVMSWLCLCSTHFQSSLDKVPTFCSFLRFHTLPGLCPKQVLLTPTSIIRLVQAVLGQGDTCPSPGLHFSGTKGRKQSKWQAGKKADARKWWNYLALYMPLYLLILSCLCSQESGRVGGARPLLPLSPAMLGDTSLMTVCWEWGSVPRAAIIGKLSLFLQE